MRRAIMLVCLAVGAACSSPAPEPGAREEAKSAEPAEAVAGAEADERLVRACFDRFLSALEGFDRAGVMNELTGAKDEMHSAAFFLDYLVAGHAFEQAFVATHGEAAWKAFNDAEGAVVMVSMPIDRSALERAKVVVEGDTARIEFEGRAEGPSFRRAEGEWKLDSISVFPHDPEGKQGAAFVRMAELLVAAKSQAEDASADTEALDRELGEALARAAAVD